MQVKNKVSIWLGHFNNEEEFNRFMTVNYNNEGEAYSSFTETMEIEYTDDDKQEIIFNSQLTKDTLRQASYADYFLDGIDFPDLSLHHYNCVVLVYDYEYNGKIKSSDNFVFIGAFQYTKEEGESINFSKASVSPHIDGDLERIKKYDALVEENKKAKRQFLLYSLIALSITGGLIRTGHPWWSIIPGIVFLFYLFSYLMMRAATPQSIYKNGLLIPSVVTSVNPIQIVAVADMRAKDEAEMIYGAKRFTYNDWPEKVNIGDKIPCAAMFASGLSDHHNNMEAHPIIFATDNKEEIEKCIAAIEYNEWNTCEKLAQLSLESSFLENKKNCGVIYYNENFTENEELN
ncbi:hypothetical protein M2459_003343 [Parabacteroides sp. PF5-5]|uniref:immunity 22 family protein n=1 Tax=unclassified Parabacteroides TaxID=2649774 RepID=UPI002472FB22|nr:MULTISPECIES: immunity 22 family protein [unclassified Parabacteroides]MDH6306664.1 hypothetical protein [Parabacteroides sp. PH5-39]MDH6317631.1 hypothetical protein [Parabacteroides sp. PF5-13]MDH6321375.1 hypothetical protein [Parabacteroides sp. PH5-13]MDH6325060.1 hypothetical protein [Parabacteroides sp. PH5-8]MDH6328769.1 hypothetical protein [Parabacteroides sp. PH5-41]